MLHKDGLVTTPITVKPSDLKRNGRKTPKKKAQTSTVWAQHEVDQSAGRHGRRYGTRDAGSTRQYGMANGYDHLEAVDFMFGEGIIPGAGAVIKNAMSGTTIAVARLADAMAYKIAAMRRGVVLDVYNV